MRSTNTADITRSVDKRLLAKKLISTVSITLRRNRYQANEQRSCTRYKSDSMTPKRGDSQTRSYPTAPASHPRSLQKSAAVSAPCAGAICRSCENRRCRHSPVPLRAWPLTPGNRVRDPTPRVVSAASARSATPAIAPSQPVAPPMGQVRGKPASNVRSRHVPGAPVSPQQRQRHITSITYHQNDLESGNSVVTTSRSSTYCGVLSPHDSGAVRSGERLHNASTRHA